ncbi:MAG: WG repeat-containing protein [Candidatus Berkelbacteria bacterium]|nr:WG repeat-containing protein [Candidatus Berkelbacteria bacterium]
MRCLEITTKLLKLPKLFAEFDDNFEAGRIGKAMEKYRNIQSEMTEIIELADLNQVLIRDRIAKQLGLNWLGKFHEGLAFGTNDESYLLVSSQGEIIKDFRDQPITGVGKFRQGSAWIHTSFEMEEWIGTSRTDNYQLIDREGEPISERFRYLDEDSDPPYLVSPLESGRLTFLDSDGKTSQYYLIATPFRDDRAWVAETINDNFKLIDTSGNVITEDILENVSPFSEGISIVDTGSFDDRGRSIWAAVSTDGSKVEFTLPFNPESINPPHNGICQIVFSEQDSEYLYGELVGAEMRILGGIEADFDSPTGFKTFEEAEDFSEGLALVESVNLSADYTGNYYKYFINRNGFPALNHFRAFIDARSFSDGMAAVRPIDPETNMTDSWIYIDTSGKPAVLDSDGRPKVFANAWSFADGVAKVADLEDGAYTDYYIDKNGKRLFGQSGRGGKDRNGN